MNETTQDLAPTKKIGVKVIYAALKILKNHDGELPGREVISEIEKTIDLNEWEKELYPKSGYIRWKSILHFYSYEIISGTTTSGRELMEKMQGLSKKAN